MRPIKLKIKGLNSFIDEQEIDFNKLTERGFFGIFGPTGSGKSTILDGITLALYGDLPRKSTNYINVNCNSLDVSFEFSIADGETKVYRVEREFKADKKTGRPKSGKCKVLDITKEKPIILAESVKEVTKTCENIIGLSLNDFTKTVVLPQGSFSEFLKISGKDKREMLERLFNLQEYGEALEKKLFAKAKVIEKELDVIKGQLTGYENINLDDLKLKEEEFKNNEKDISKKSLELLDISKNYEEGKEVFALQGELKEFLEEKEKIELKEEDIKNKKLKIENIEKALKVLSFVENHKGILSVLEKSKIALDKYNEEFQKVDKEKEDILKKYNVLSKEKHERIPELKVEGEKLNLGIKNKMILESLNSQIIRLKEDSKGLKVSKDNEEEKLSDFEKSIKEMSLNIKALEEEYDSLKVDIEFKRNIEEAIKFEKDYKDLGKDIKEYIDVLKDLENKKNNYIDEKKNLKSNIDKNSLSLKNYETLLEDLEKNCPGNDETLLEKKRLLRNLKEKLEKFNSYKEKIGLNEGYILKINEDLNKAKNNKSNIEKNIISLDKEKETLETESLAVILRKKLEEGNPCPVCGSIHHNEKTVEEVDLGILDEVKNNLSLNNKNLIEQEKEIAKLQEKLKAKNSEIESFNEEIKALGEDFKDDKVNFLEKDIEVLEEAIKEYKEKKIDLQDKIISFKEESNNLNSDIKVLNTNINNNEEKLIEKQKEQKQNIIEFNDLEITLNEKRDYLKIDDFEEEYKRILKREKDREELEKDIKEKRIDKEDKERQREIINKQKEKLVNELVSKEASLKEKEKQKEDLENSLRNEFNDLDNLEERLKNINKEIEFISNEFKKCEEDKSLIENDFDSIKEKLNKETLNFNDLKDKEKAAKVELDNILELEGFSDTSKVQEILIDRENLDNFKEEVENYEEDIKNIEINIKNIHRKLNGREISEEEYKVLNDIKIEKEGAITSLKNINLILNKEIISMKEEIEKFKEIIKKKTKIEHDEAILNDLKKLFSGRKFVDYVATERLKYVALEASKRLREITNDNYSLEIDKDGKFMIRDFKNGGLTREISTLSGGETFLTSLALALALSTGLQLKKTAPLELFFLDEGFGTLDDDLLETVISSLERIHHDKLKIGIISHVESIKNRVPVKLIVTPAESGMGGSKVKIERN